MKIFQERGFNRCQLSLQGTKLKGKKKGGGEGLMNTFSFPPHPSVSKSTTWPHRRLG